MEQFEQLCSDMWDWLSSPFRRNIPVSQLALILVIWLVIAIALYDGVKILGNWMADHAADLAKSGG